MTSYTERANPAFKNKILNKTKNKIKTKGGGNLSDATKTKIKTKGDNLGDVTTNYLLSILEAKIKNIKKACLKILIIFYLSGCGQTK